MSSHLGGATSKWSQNLYDINRQLRTGKTIKGKDLTDEKREELEAKKETILGTMGAAKEARHDERMKDIMDHTTKVGNEVVEKIGKQLDDKLGFLVTPGNGNIDEEIAAHQNQVKIHQATIAAKRVEKKRAATEAAAKKKRDSAQKKVDAQAAREEKKKSKRKGKDKSPAEEVASTAEPDEEENIESSDEDLPQTPSTEMPEENVEDCTTLQEAREYYDFVKECAARCDEYAKFMLGDLTEKGAIEELASKLKRERLAWFSPKCNMFGGKQLQKLVEKIVTKITYGTPEMTKNVAAALNYDLSDTGSQHRVKYLKDFFVMSSENKIMAVVACLP